MKPDAFFLAKDQKTAGPFTAADIEVMRASGELANYSWILQQGDSSWTALDSAPILPVPAPKEEKFVPPPPPPAAYAQKNRASASEATPDAIIQKPRSQKSEPQFQVKQTKVRTSSEAFRAILFDSRSAVTAWLSEASGDGCEIRADLEEADPLFVEKSSALLNLHELATGKTTQVTVEIDRVFRREKAWVYKVRWSAVPAIFAASQAA